MLNRFTVIFVVITEYKHANISYILVEENPCPSEIMIYMCGNMVNVVDLGLLTFVECVFTLQAGVFIPEKGSQSERSGYRE